MIKLESSKKGLEKGLAGKIANIVSGAIFLCVPLLWFVVGTRFMGDRGFLMFLSFCGMAIVIMAIMFGIRWLIFYVWRNMVQGRVTEPEVYASAQSLAVGETFEVEFRASTGDLVVETVYFDLMQREWVKWTAGTDTHTAEHDVVVHTVEKPGATYRKGQFIQEQVELQIPTDAMHTLAYPHNRLSWSIRVRMAIPTWPDFAEEFPISVLARKAEATSDF